MKNSGGTDMVDLRGLNIVPGIYDMVYTFTDPISQETAQITRKLIVLPSPGDVDMDGAVTTLDASVLGENMVEWNADTGAVMKLVRGRVLDRDHNNRIDASDVTALYQGFQPLKTGRSYGGDYYYIPLPQGTAGGAPARARKTWQQLQSSTTTTPAGEMTLRFLGVETGQRDLESTKGITSNIAGPWAVDPNGAGIEIPDYKNNRSGNDTFWMGVYLDPGDLAGRDVEEFTITLIYDSRYVTPAAVYDQQRYEAMQSAGITTEQAKWETSLRYYNFRQGAYNGAEKNVIWATNDGDNKYQLTAASTLGREYDTTHYSKVISHMEQTAESTNTLREMVFSIKADASVALQEGYVLVVPFRLLEHPQGVQEGETTRLIELGAGMRDINMVADRPMSFFARLFSRSGSARVASAFSAQDDIYGGATENLREKLDLNVDDPEGMIKVGVDRSETKELFNQAGGNTASTIRAEYDTYFENTVVVNGGENVPGLPEGLSYNQASGLISGSPIKVGTHTFSIRGQRYKIVVEPRTIRYYADSVYTFYGEGEYRCESGDDYMGLTLPSGEIPGDTAGEGGGPRSYRTFTFKYYDRDIAPRDKAQATADFGIQWNEYENDNQVGVGRDGAELAQVLKNFTAPKFVAAGGYETTLDRPLDVITVKSPASTDGYQIYAVTTPRAENYVFEYVEKTPQAQPAGKLYIVSRPIYLDYMTMVADHVVLEGEVYHDMGTVSVQNIVAKSNQDPMVFTLNGATEDKDNHIPLTGEAVVPGDYFELRFNGVYQRNDYDKEHSDKNFVLQQERETRTIKISNITLNNDEAKRNYSLRNSALSGPLNEALTDVQGWVRRRGVEEISIYQAPSELNANNQRTITYGEGVGDPSALMVSIRNGTGTSETIKGNYQYNADQALELGLHYNWVTPEEYEAGKDNNTLAGTGRSMEPDSLGNDLRPYGDVRDGQRVEVMPYNSFTPAQDGWRLCISVGKYTTENALEYVKLYTVPIKVQQRQVILEPVAVNRYYGDPNGTLSYNYEVNGLLPADREKIEAHFGKATGKMEELEWLLEQEQLFYNDFNAEFGTDNAIETPVIRAQKGANDPTPVDERTPAAALPYAVVLSGGKSVNYRLSYRFPQGSGSGVSDAQGWNNLIINKRPIVVNTVTRAAGFANLYADTRNLLVTKNDPLSPTAGEVGFILPTKRQTGNGCPTYYVNFNSPGYPNSDQKVDSTVPFADDNAPAVVNGDEARLQVEYGVTFIPDKLAYNDFTNSYFPVENFQSDDPKFGVQENGSRQVNVQIDKLVLTGEAAGNYQLVYETSSNAQQRTPATVTNMNGPNPNAQEGMQEQYTYQVGGKGYVWLRPIKGFTFSSLGKMVYTYGDTFTPDVPGSDGNRMTLMVEYETKYENDPEHNISREPVQFQPTATGTSFGDRGFTLGYVKDGQSIAQADASGQYLTYLQYLYPGEHDGARLWIKGQRSEGDPVIYSTQATVERLEVKRRTLTLTATDVHRFYGEPNESTGRPFSFTVLAKELAQPELDALGLSRPGVNDRVQGADLAAVVDGYKAPRFSTPATPASPVGEGKWGTYDLTMTSGGNWDNYLITTEGAKVYVYPRPIQVSGIVSGPTQPVYTIFHNTLDTVFATQLGTAPDESHAVVQVELPLGGQFGMDLADGSINYPLPYSGTALYGNDQLVFNADVTYLDFVANEENFSDRLDLRTQTEIKDIVGNNNYFLVFGSNTTYDTTGAAKLRSIASIHLIAAPKLTYTYGESLDLSGLRVQIFYQQVGTENQENVYVNYQGQEQFQSYGLYVNYYDKRDIPAQSTWKDVPSTYRKASSGDHVTIAPTHDTQGGNAFAANGKYLIVSAFQAGMGQDPAQPKILGENDRNYYEGAPTPIVVKPRQLTYTLSADDKTYDGTGATSGTVTLTNVYQKDNYVDAYNGQGVTDVVYIPVGASYESASDDHHNATFDAYKARVKNGQVSFSTGSYVPNGQAPLLANGYTAWSANQTDGTYRYGTGLLDFTFVNPNVHYEDDTFAEGLPGLGSSALAQYWAMTQPKNTVTGQWDTYNPVSKLPVAVTNMKLAGPDAANYTWGPSDQPRVDTTEVTVETRAGAQNGQAAAPYATIQKANRDTIQTLAGSGVKLPSLSLDNHTNVVRLSFDQPLDVLGDNNNQNKAQDGAATTDVFRDELHFEYALYYQDKESGLYRQWAGRTGGRNYQDTRFFGGEPVVLWVSPDFIPTVNQLPKEENAGENTIYKGQRYRWAGEDTGLSPLGYREDSGFILAPEAYPGGPEFRDAYWFYDLYKTDRTALPRDTVMYPLVRLSETHNYNASGCLTGDTDVTAELLDAAQKALANHQTENSDATQAELERASQALFAASDGMEQAAQDAAQKRMEEDAAIAAEGRWPEEPPTYENAASAVKTYTQRLDLVSSERKRSDSQLTQDTTDYLVKMLEAVWFTDTLVYEEQKELDAVLYNHPTRYYGYFYDIDKSARLNFSEQPFSLEDVIADIPVRVRQEDGTILETTITVNQDHTITLYVNITDGGNNQVRYIELNPSVLNVTLGTPPFLLEVITEPVLPSNRSYRWETSDPAVAVVDENGLVTFRGLGTAVITVYTNNGHSASCVVTVTAALTPQDTGRLFNTLYTGSYMELDSAGNFYPKKSMTRGELVTLLDLFCRPGAIWHKELEVAYVDVTNRERYAEALRRMTKAGVVDGMPGGKFEGEREATRAEFATMMARFLELTITDTRNQKHAFQDAGAADTWAYAYIDALAQIGVVQGVDDGVFQPNRPVTREEVAAVLARLLTIPLDMERTDLKIPADVTPENWSYAAIIRAVNQVEFPAPTQLPENEA